MKPKWVIIWFGTSIRKVKIQRRLKLPWAIFLLLYLKFQFMASALFISENVQLQNDVKHHSFWRKTSAFDLIDSGITNPRKRTSTSELIDGRKTWASVDSVRVNGLDCVRKTTNATAAWCCTAVQTGNDSKSTLDFKVPDVLCKWKKRWWLIWGQGIQWIFTLWMFVRKSELCYQSLDFCITFDIKKYAKF